MKRENSWNWYGVKIIKQVIIKGEPDPKLIDEFFDDDGKQDFEESIMLVRAQSFNHAYELAEKRAKEDDEFYPNIYGQQVAWKFIEAVDCFLIFDKLKTGAEVYSCFHQTDKKVTADEFLKKYFDKIENGCHKARHL